MYCKIHCFWDSNFFFFFFLHIHISRCRYDQFEGF
ncbi:hypothetical protein AMTRI_Chr12g238830 [Amborella trichopoda]